MLLPATMRSDFRMQHLCLRPFAGFGKTYSNESVWSRMPNSRSWNAQRLIVLESLTMNVENVWPCVSYVNIPGKRIQVDMRRNGKNQALMVRRCVDAPNAKRPLRRTEAAIIWHAPAAVATLIGKEVSLREKDLGKAMVVQVVLISTSEISLVMFRMRQIQQIRQGICLHNRMSLKSRSLPLLQRGLSQSPPCQVFSAAHFVAHQAQHFAAHAAHTQAARAAHAGAHGAHATRGTRDGQGSHRTQEECAMMWTKEVCHSGCVCCRNHHLLHGLGDLILPSCQLSEKCCFLDSRIIDTFLVTYFCNLRAMPRCSVCWKSKKISCNVLPCSAWMRLSLSVSAATKMREFFLRCYIMLYIYSCNKYHYVDLYLLSIGIACHLSQRIVACQNI